jgi:uncharacterized protein CbrC (UPF0167 family)
MTDIHATVLPQFKYHPDPVATGSIVRSDVECKACGLVRGWIYTGAIYSQADLDDGICPWCIADGTAHSKFDTEFVDIGSCGDWSGVPESIVEEIRFRTPSFNGWQQEQWFAHCDDAGIFVGCSGKSELESLDKAALAAIKLESGYDEEQWTYYFEQMDANHGPTAYLFRCRHCSAWGGYSDCA